MNILILGGAGFLGSSCAKALCKENQVVIADRVCKEIENVISVKVDLTNIDNIFDIIKKYDIDCVMHLVSSLLPSSDVTQYLNDIYNVYNPTLRLLDFCSENKIKFVYFSSGGAVYGNQKEIFNEHTKRDPVSYYGLSKLNFENLIQFYHKNKGLQYLIIRPSNPYGYGQNLYGKQGIIAVIIGKIISKETIEIWGDGNAIKDYIYIDDFIYYVSKLLYIENAWNDVYNVGTGRGISVNEVLQTFRELDIKLPEVKYINALNADVNRMVLDCTKLQELIPHKNSDLAKSIEAFYSSVVGDING